ncbi:MBOAT family O-acyltransferase [Ornithinibacillus sp. 179-J 7C1 HS]|uniref:MBOAT family O-acyltransferase n=1 Tax=Ornithinibacillus sp. 179-J 7C1 HS TaxID=3142384 RepID=UPI00399F6D6D
MLFNSFEFIFVFLPIVFTGYFLINRMNVTLAKVWLLTSSLFFYSWWNPNYLLLIFSSLIVNFIIGTLLAKQFKQWVRKSILTIGILFNVGLLGFYKYYDFFITNVNLVFGFDFVILHLVLPLAISFYTFQQIAYLVDSYRFETNGYNFLNYALFVTFFPQLIAGPIVHHQDVMAQYEDQQKKKINYRNIGLGLFMFAIGLFKKVGVADTFSVWANNGYDMAEGITFVDAWVTSLSYTFQLYYDFSGYSDMAIGLGLLFNIVLPINFNSPYKATGIIDFWKRWHITLTKFLTRYIYIPLGGNRKGITRTYINVMIIYLISGFWHGAGWTFVFWGFLHGVASVINRIWTKAGFRMNKLLAWFITFQFINATWVFFRAPNFEVAIDILRGMVGLNGLALPEVLQDLNWVTENVSDFYVFTIDENFWFVLLFLLGGFLIVVLAKNAAQLMEKHKPNVFSALFVSALLVYSVFQLQKVSEFLYFNF